MIKVRLTFFNTVMEDLGGYRLNRSTTPKHSFEFIYKTNNSKRAMSFAKRAKRRLVLQDPDLGHNTRIEVRPLTNT